MDDEIASSPTLGERLDDQGRRAAARPLPRLSWPGLLRAYLDRATSVATACRGRFDRVEAVPNEAATPLLATAGARSARGSAAAARPDGASGSGAVAGAPWRPAATSPPGPAPVPRAVAADAGRPLPAEVRSRLRDVAGPGADALRVHDDAASDSLARAHRADAVTVDRDVHFGRGRFDPRGERGWGLLVHEATHVLALLRPGAAWRRATATGLRQEEELAMTRERQALGPDRTRVGATPGPPTAAPAPAAAPPAPPPCAKPLPAPAQRDTGSPPAPPPVDLDALRRDLVSELMRRIRTEFERGGPDVHPLTPATAPARGGTVLAKALIVNTVTGTGFPVMYNPEEFRVEQGNTFAEVGIPGLDSPPVQYVRGKARALVMDLFFDTYETGEDVRDHTAPIVRLLDTDPQTHAPPVLLFSLGRFQFRCVLVDAAQRFTMFLRDGTPVRSTLAVRFQEYVRGAEVEIRSGFFVGPPTLSAAVDTATRGALAGPGSAHTVVAGDTLSGLAATYLGDPALWRDIARANGMTDPFDLPPGRTLVIPARGTGARPAGGGPP
ncbi:hypothetical protein GCM10025787_24900 [Saccharopolyspora rosea]|uniref:CIS tube protein n=1 Tax=Saccharopolyspora rosea TaxID=524884 RepID=UPI0031EC53BC